MQPIPTTASALPAEQPKLSARTTRERIRSIDFARGLVMIIMALDHTRDMFHINALVQSPTNLATTTPALFFTRWITHLCAPTFVFLAGASAYLSSRLTGNTRASRNFLLSRGIVLVLMEFTVINFGLSFDVHFRLLLFEVIGAIGFSMIVLALCLSLPPRVIGLIGLLIIAGHDALLMAGVPPQGPFSLLFAPGPIPLGRDLLLTVAYPPIPWMGIMFAGYGAGSLMTDPAVNRKKLFIRAGITALSLFIVLRAINIYGDPVPWAAQKDGLFTFLSFMNITKYPPSLSFTLATLGVSFFVLAWAEGRKGKWMDITFVYGKVPMFYFIVHFYLIHLLVLALIFIQGYHWNDLDFSSFRFGRPQGKSGLPLWGVYLVWLAVVVSMYPLCKWYGNYKAAHRDNPLLRYI